MLKILEIGYGDAPSFGQGEIYRENAVEFTGLELPDDTPNHFSWRDKRITQPFKVVSGDMSNMHMFADETFDYVLMRSVYGQMRGNKNLRAVLAVRRGMVEVTRVLKASGFAVIAEENTPRDSVYIAGEMLGAGLRIETCENMTKPWEDTTLDDPWRVTRAVFYNDTPIANGHFPNGFSHITIAQKPEKLQIEKRSLEVFPMDGSGPVIRTYQIPELDYAYITAYMKRLIGED